MRVHFQCTIHEKEVATILILSKMVKNSKVKVLDTGSKKVSSLNSFKMYKSVLPDAYITSSHLSDHNEYDRSASETNS
ncbi:unnamed protein product [Brugia timori]|uniref:Ovule protein n=1 Tax=Brugia timori TaxID=42155 RepID=A0A0R3QVM0_9BILA|nr:unnamed protein product [Brugia timori]